MDMEAKSKIDFQVFSYVSRIQNEHGASTEDFKGYRQYCCKKLRRIRKRNNGFYLQKGEGNSFCNKDVLTSARSVAKEYSETELLNIIIEILIVQAERAWAYSVEIKGRQEQEEAENGVRNRHRKNRMKKAITWSIKCCSICDEFANKATQMKAKAYSLYLKGIFAFENQELEPAARCFSELLKVYGQLNTVVLSSILQPKSEEISYYLKYCKRYLSEGQQIKNDKVQADNQNRVDLKNDSQLVSVFGVEINIPDSKVRSEIEEVWENFVLFQSMFQENDITEVVYMKAFAGLDELMSSLRKLRSTASNSAELAELNDILLKARHQIVGQNSLLRLREVILKKEMEKLNNIYRLSEKTERSLVEAEEFTVKNEMIEVKMYKSFLLAIFYLKEGKQPNAIKCLSLMNLCAELLDDVELIEQCKDEFKLKLVKLQAEAVLQLKPESSSSIAQPQHSTVLNKGGDNDSKQKKWFQGWFS